MLFWVFYSPWQDLVCDYQERFPLFSLFLFEENKGKLKLEEEKEEELENPRWQKHLQFGAGFDKVKLLHTLILNTILSLYFFIILRRNRNGFFFVTR